MAPLKVLDLFCGAGGASDGYVRAGYEVVGVDIDPQPHYPYDFIQANALTFIQENRLQEYTLIHASPPCQGYSKAVTSQDSKWVPTRGKAEPKLIEDVRTLLNNRSKNYVIENVMSAKPYLLSPELLCGTMFGLPLSRHRLFETNFSFQAPEHPKCRGIAKKYSIDNDIEYRDMSVTGKGRHAGTSERWSKIMGINRFMRQHDYAEAIPPAYTEWIGRKFAEKWGAKMSSLPISLTVFPITVRHPRDGLCRT